MRDRISADNGLLCRAWVLGVLGVSLWVSPAAARRGAADPQRQVARANTPVVLLAAGDIASDGPGAARTAAIVAKTPGMIAALGDLAYPDGGQREFDAYWQPTWGPFKNRIRPAVGNHEYHTPGAGAYFDYFGLLAGHREQGWYAYDMGSAWRAIVLNSNAHEVGGCDPSSPQYRWLSRELTQHARKNVVAYWHHPVFSSGAHGDAPWMRPIWSLLVERGADVVLAGHDHGYERFEPMDGAGLRDDRRGLRSWVVGTGGASYRPFIFPPRDTSAVRQAGTFGILKLNLLAKHIEWDFLAEGGSAFRDTGAAAVR